MTADPTADSSGTAPTLTATPDPADVTDSLSIELSGLAPGQRVTIDADFADLGAEWASEATFDADADGRVDLTEQAPVAGDYDGVRPMGLVQFAERTSDDAVSADTGAETTDLRLTARVDDDPVASTTVTRRIAPGVERTELDPETDGVGGVRYTPASEGPHPGVLALHGSGGDPLGRKGRALAAEGYVVLALEYVGGPSPVPETFAEVPVSYAGDALDYLHAREGVTDGDLGVVGVSRGTELAMLVAAERDDVGVVVAYAPSAYTWFGDGDGDGPPPAAWAVDGEALPVLPHPGPGAEPVETDQGVRFRPMFEAFVEEAPEGALREARLPVEDVAADVVLVSGGDDGVWPAGGMADTIVDAMADAPGMATHHHFPDAGHGIFVPYHPTAERATVTQENGPTVLHGGTASGAADADRDSWTAALDALGALR